MIMTKQHMSVQVVGYGKVDKQPGEAFERGAGDLPYFGLVHLVEGGGLFQSKASGEIDVCAGDTIMLIPGNAHSYGPKSGHVWSEFWILLDGVDCGLLTAASPVLRSSFPEIWRAISLLGSGTIDAARCDALAMALYGLTIDSAIERAGRGESDVVEAITSAMSDRVADPMFDFDSAARSLGYSSVHMRRLFKSAKGESPVKCFNRMKIENAKRQLIYTSKSVHTIACELGWVDDAYFRRVFKSFEGLSPQHWRQRRMANGKSI